MANAVYCKDCVHHEECYARMKELGIKVYVEGLVDCDGYEEVEHGGSDT